MRKPNSTSARCSSDNLRPSRKPATGISGCNHGVASINATPSFCNSLAIAPKIVWALRSLSLNSTPIARRSGRTSKRFLGAICPSITHCVTPAIREGADELGELPDFDPHHFIRERRDAWIRLAFERDGDDAFHARGARLSGEQQGQRAIARDDADGFYR
jgi:hypothetical protein